MLANTALVRRMLGWPVLRLELIIEQNIRLVYILDSPADAGLKAIQAGGESLDERPSLGARYLHR